MKKRIKKLISIVIILLTMTTHTAYSQIFLMDMDQGENPRVESEDMWLIIPIEGLDGDQYLPIGNGVMLLSTLGGLYFLAKRRKNTPKK